MDYSIILWFAVGAAVILGIKVLIDRNKNASGGSRPSGGSNGSPINDTPIE